MQAAEEQGNEITSLQQKVQALESSLQRRLDEDVQNDLLRRSQQVLLPV